jgi:hypothetical protein
MAFRLSILAATLVVSALSCAGNQPIVRHLQDPETNTDIKCEGFDWGGNALPHGFWTCFWPGGKIHSRGKYIEGAKSGTWTYYDQDGLKISTEFWKKGSLEWSTFGDKAASGEGFRTAE